MKNTTYLAVLEEGEDGGFGISFPDLPGCFSFSDTMIDAQKMATEAAELHVYNLEKDGETVPVPSASLTKEQTEGMTIMPVTIHPDLYRLKRENERVKTNVTIPAWLKQIAEENKVNYSRVLENALMDYLNIATPVR